MIRSFVVGLLALLIVSLALAVPMTWLWNTCLVPAITVLAPVEWIQMWGMLGFFYFATRTARS